MPGRTSKTTQTIIQELKTLGFSEYEARIYVSLIETSPTTAYELAKKSGVPRPNAYSALSSLSDRGAAMPVSENPVRYVARDPKEHISSIAKRTLATCEDLVEKLSEIATPAADDYVWNLLGEAEIFAKMSEMIEQAQDVIWIKAGPEVLRPHREALIEMTGKRGVKLSVILFGDDADEFQFNDNCKIHIHEASGTRMGSADNLFTMTIDHGEMLTANEDDGIQAAYTQNKAVVTMALSLIRHDYYMAEIFARFKGQIDAAFGPHLLDLRRQSYTEEQLASFKEKTGTKG